MLEKYYKHELVEKEIYESWEKDKDFVSKVTDKNSKPFCIVIPPPNVTGTLHMGHALNNTLQDILIRYQRMQGKDVLWQPGMDHAGIATEMVVERELKKEGIEKSELSREEFVKKVWEWKDLSGGLILNQLKRLGSSCNWDRERFTFDKGLSEAVRKVFVELFNQGLIYRDKRLSNWDPKLKTTISDLEVVQKEIKGSLWYIEYDIEESEDKIIVATTRPETMLGDTGIAVHPDDDRYKKLVGKNAILPLVNKSIKIVSDEYAKSDQGSGAVKITPAHDFNDFEVGKRNNLEVINIFDENACLNENVPEKYIGLDRYDARIMIVEDLEVLGKLVKVEENLHTVPYGDRSDVVIEPLLTDQWFVDAEKLAVQAIKKVKDKETKFIPQNWEKTYFEWMENIQPWCISRQLWWGHRIPAYYFGKDKDDFVVAENISIALNKARLKSGNNKLNENDLIQDPDVLDTWFSSWLWPISVFDGIRNPENALHHYKLRTKCNKLNYVDYTPTLQHEYVGDKYPLLLEKYMASIAATTINYTTKYFEIPAAGCLSFMEVNNLNGAEKLGFKDFENSVFINEQNYEKKFNEFLESVNDPKWENIAKSGHEHVMKNLTNDNAVESLLLLIKKIIS